MSERSKGSYRLIALVSAFAATIPIANWMIGHVGVNCVPCLLPVAPGLMAPSGVVMIGVALVLRDMVHEAGGVGAALLAIATGAFVSVLVAPPAWVIASAVAFTVAELADLVVYTPLREKRLGLAVLLSGVVGAIVDSALFLYLAFGSLDFIAGQVVGKAWMSLIAFAIIHYRGLQTIR